MKIAWFRLKEFSYKEDNESIDFTIRLKLFIVIKEIVNEDSDFKSRPVRIRLIAVSINC